MKPTKLLLIALAVPLLCTQAHATHPIAKTIGGDPATSRVIALSPGAVEGGRVGMPLPRAGTDTEPAWHAALGSGNEGLALLLAAIGAILFIRQRRRSD